MLRRCAAKSNSFTARLAAFPIEIANLASMIVVIVSTSEPAALISVKIRVFAVPCQPALILLDCGSSGGAQ
jgi:hypothetical protein